MRGQKETKKQTLICNVVGIDYFQTQDIDGRSLICLFFYFAEMQNKSMAATYVHVWVVSFVSEATTRERGTSNTVSPMTSVDIVLTLYFTTYIIIRIPSWQQADNETTPPP